MKNFLYSSTRTLLYSSILVIYSIKNFFVLILVIEFVTGTYFNTQDVGVTLTLTQTTLLEPKNDWVTLTHTLINDFGNPYSYSTPTQWKILVFTHTLLILNQNSSTPTSWFNTCISKKYENFVVQILSTLNNLYSLTQKNRKLIFQACQLKVDAYTI